MARGHPVATIVIEATDQQPFRCVACDRVAVALCVELGLHRVKEIRIEDGGLLTGEDFTLEGDFADIEPIAQEMGERTAREGDPSNRAPGLERPHLGDDPSFTKVGHEAAEAAKLEITPKDGPHPLGLRLNHDNLAVPGRVPQGTMPPTHSPLRLEAAILSRMRSEVTSRSN